MKKQENILVISDLHLPFEHKKALTHCKKVYREYNCTKVINLGDVVDSYCFGSYLRDPDAMQAREEVKSAQKHIRTWATAFPDMIITRGNHDMRLGKRLLEIGIPHSLVLRTLSDIFEMPTTWVWKDNYWYKDVLYMHGVKSGQTAHIRTATDMRCNVVIGHAHSGCGVQYISGHNDTIFGFNAGCLVDRETYAFSYGKDETRKGVVGCGVMIEGKIPVFIRM